MKTIIYLLLSFVDILRKEGFSEALIATELFLKRLIYISRYKLCSNSSSTFFSSSIPDHITFNTSPTPEISIIIPVYNNYKYTAHCLLSIAQNFPDQIAIEIIVVDDTSTDHTQKALEKHFSGLRILRNQSNKGFLASANIGAKLASAKYLYFLNNDTAITPHAIDSLYRTLENYPQAGACGSKLLFPNGLLQEAGAIMWNDATAWNYGRNDNPHCLEYNYLRQVDYCSGASLMVRSDLFRILGGFNENYSPAYYEDVDLCFSIRKLGYKVLYQPQSQVIHFEGKSSELNPRSPVKAFQEKNRHKFLISWGDTLTTRPFGSRQNAQTWARKLNGAKSILMIDSYLTLHDREAGSNRLFQIIKILRERGFHIILHPDNNTLVEPYCSDLQQLGIEIVTSRGLWFNSKAKMIRSFIRQLDYVWICRPELCARYSPLIKSLRDDIPIIYDTIDLHHLRLKRQFDREPKNNFAQQWQYYENLEISLARSSNATIVVSAEEKELLESRGANNIHIVPTIHSQTTKQIPSFNDRKGLFFVGSFNHPPNIDAVRWLVNEIMPIVWSTNPEITLDIVGWNPTSDVSELSQQNVIVHGYQKNIEPFYFNSRVFVAPLRFGAGMKGKLGESMSYGLPLVTTPIGSEGFNFEHKKNAMIASTATEFAQAVIDLYQQEELWESLSRNSLEKVKTYSPEQVLPKIKTLFDSLTIN